MAAAVECQRPVVELCEFILSEKHLSGCWTVQSAQNIEKSRFSRTGGAQHHDHLGAVKFNVDAPQSVDFASFGFVHFCEADCLEGNRRVS